VQPHHVSRQEQRGHGTEAVLGLIEHLLPEQVVVVDEADVGVLVVAVQVKFEAANFETSFSS
jgi:hypothetical protein